GSRYSIEVQGKNIPYKGETLRVTEFRDISERKEFEWKILEQNKRLTTIAEDLKKKNEQLDEFTQIVSHNLRSPVSNILSLLDFYEKADDEPEKSKLLWMLRESGTKILTNLKELNEVLKIKQAKEIERQQLAFSEVLQSVIQQLSAPIAETRAEIKTSFFVRTVQYPNIYLESIIMNLLSNALKYKHPARTPEILIETFENNGNLFLKITDNGLGLDLKRYGNHVFKLRKTFHVHPESRGIGLFMIKSQIEAMGGEIQIESQPNIGTSFIVLLSKS
ncbi:MAG: sensor histidine kinase, partial [Cytophagales bacterium]